MLMRNDWKYMKKADVQIQTSAFCVNCIKVISCYKSYR